MIKNLWGAAKAVLRGKFIAIESYLMKQEKTLNRQSNFIPKTTGRRRRKKTPKLVEGKKSKIWTEINEKEMKETIVKINKTKSWSFEKMNKIDKLLAWLIKKKERRIKPTKLEMKKERLQQTMQKCKRL